MCAQSPRRAPRTSHAPCQLGCRRWLHQRGEAVQPELKGAVGLASQAVSRGDSLDVGPAVVVLVVGDLRAGNDLQLESEKFEQGPRGRGRRGEQDASVILQDPAK